MYSHYINNMGNIMAITKNPRPIEIAIVSGANGSLGTALLLKLGQVKNRFCFGLQRDSAALQCLPPVNGEPCRVMWWPCDISDFSGTEKLIYSLLNQQELKETLAAINGRGFSDEEFYISKITLIHAVGPFKYEGYHDDKTHDIDPQILRMNYEAFKNMGDAVLEAVKKLNPAPASPVQVNLCTFGSVSEEYQVPLWYSFNQAKAKARHYMESKVKEYAHSPGIHVSSLYFRTSTIDTGKENKLRPNVPEDIRRYWLAPDKVAETVCVCVDKIGPGTIEKTDIIKAMPEFDAETYYTDTKKLDEHWRGMMPKH